MDECILHTSTQFSHAGSHACYVNVCSHTNIVMYEPMNLYNKDNTVYSYIQGFNKGVTRLFTMHIVQTSL